MYRVAGFNKCFEKAVSMFRFYNISMRGSISITIHQKTVLIFSILTLKWLNWSIENESLPFWRTVFRGCEIMDSGHIFRWTGSWLLIVRVIYRMYYYEKINIEEDTLIYSYGRSFSCVLPNSVYIQHIWWIFENNIVEKHLRFNRFMACRGTQCDQIYWYIRKRFSTFYILLCTSCHAYVVGQ